MSRAIQGALSLVSVLIWHCHFLDPAEFGLACHLGVLSGLPCVGVAKNLLQVQGVYKSEEHQSQVRLFDNLLTRLELTGFFPHLTKLYVCLFPICAVELCHPVARPTEHISVKKMMKS